MASSAQGAIAFVIILVIIVLLWYFTVGFGGLGLGKTTSTSASTTSATTTTVAAANTATSTTSILYVYNCNALSLYMPSNASKVVAECSWSGGKLGLWAGSGNLSRVSFLITGADNKTYVNQSSDYQCITFFENFTAPPQLYKISFMAGNFLNNSQSQCTLPTMKLNTSLSPPKQVYQQVYNGRFQNGQYTGWTLNGSGFGTAPLNITFANNQNTNALCYLSSQWKNYNGTYFATTFNCGLTVSPGNLTSSPFKVVQPFLNFRIISPDNNFLYLEVLSNSTPYTIAHFNTYNTSAPWISANAASTFLNASVPLFNVAGKVVQVRVVAQTLTSRQYIAVGDFTIARSPHIDSYVWKNYTFLH